MQLSTRIRILYWTLTLGIIAIILADCALIYVSAFSFRNPR